MDIEYLRTLSLVAKLKNMSKAAELVGITPSGIKRQMQNLEKLLKTKLYQGFPNGIQMTDEGDFLASEAEELCARYESTIARLQTLKSGPTGPLKLIISNFGMSWFTDHALEFSQRFPDINLKISMDEFKSIFYPSSLSGVFVFLLASEPPKNHPFIWHKLGSYKWYPFAHPDYLKKYGHPLTLSDLDKHLLIRYEWDSPNLALGEDYRNILLYVERPSNRPRQAVMTTDDTLCCKNLIEKGLGIGLLPRFLVRSSPLIEVLQDTFPSDDSVNQSLYLVYPDYLKKNERVNFFCNFIKEKIESHSPFI